MAPEQAVARGKGIGPATTYTRWRDPLRMPDGASVRRRDQLGGSWFKPPNDDPRARRARLRPRLARDLDTICLKAPPKDPLRRYGSAADLGADWNGFGRGRGHRARARKQGTSWRAAYGSGP